MRRRLLLVPVLALSFLVLGSTAALACGGLVAPGHAEVLRRATTLSAWHAGFEHYVTGFQFAGSASSFGYIVPLPAVPTKIEKGGDWTLERLAREISPPVPTAFAAAGASRDSVQVIQRVRIDALDITVVRGGGTDVAAWAARNGFDLTPDTATVMNGYSSKGAVFALAKFDGTEATQRGLVEGQGTTIHFTIPMAAPWIPLRILALGKTANEAIDADLFILTDHAPQLDPAIWDLPGATLRAYRPAGDGLLQDLRSDKGMEWLPPAGMWFTALSIHVPAALIGDDLSIDGGGPPNAGGSAPGLPAWTWWLAAGLGLVAVAGSARAWRPGGPQPRPA